MIGTQFSRFPYRELSVAGRQQDTLILITLEQTAETQLMRSKCVRFLTVR
jgi:hypothetical protein